MCCCCFCCVIVHTIHTCICIVYGLFLEWTVIKFYVMLNSTWFCRSCALLLLLNSLLSMTSCNFVFLAGVWWLKACRIIHIDILVYLSKIHTKYKKRCIKHQRILSQRHENEMDGWMSFDVFFGWILDFIKLRQNYV